MRKRGRLEITVRAQCSLSLFHQEFRPSPSSECSSGIQLGLRSRTFLIHHETRACSTSIQATKCSTEKSFLPFSSSLVATWAVAFLKRRRYTHTRFSWRGPKAMGGVAVVAVWKLPRGLRRRFLDGELARRYWHTGVTLHTMVWLVW